MAAGFGSIHPGVSRQIPRGTHPGEGLDFSPGAANPTLLNPQAARSDQLSSEAFLPVQPKNVPRNRPSP